jgi:hypothetical protein
MEMRLAGVRQVLQRGAGMYWDNRNHESPIHPSLDHPTRGPHVGANDSSSSKHRLSYVQGTSEQPNDFEMGQHELTNHQKRTGIRHLQISRYLRFEIVLQCRTFFFGIGIGPLTCLPHRIRSCQCGEC